MAQRSHRFCLVLHTHLPYLLNHGRWPHGSDWLNEAAVECYLPLLDMLQRLARDRVPARLTLNLSPVLTEQLASDRFRQEFDFFLETRLRYCEDNRGYFQRTGQTALARLADFWEAYFQRMRQIVDGLKGNLVTGFAELEASGHVEIITCAATHGYLPLLSRDESLHLQLRTAVETHRRHFGRPPRGIWLPECAYRPRGPWQPPAGTGGAAQAALRPGLEELLALYGLRFFVADTHLLQGGQTLSAYRDFFPVLRGLATAQEPPARQQPSRSPYRPYLVASPGGRGEAVAFIRDPKSTLQVWSRDAGYPGDEWYLEFHKKHFPGGMRYWRVTGPGVDLGDKAVYEPQRAEARALDHARHFVALTAEILRGHEREAREYGTLCAPYDAELFGHWWFEGPRWLEEVFRELGQTEIRPATLSEALESSGLLEPLMLPEGSWGEGGDHRVWVNRETEWTWQRIYEAEQALAGWSAPPAGASPLLRRLLAQACRELLLLQASDWQFLITTWSARDYAEQRFTEHQAAFSRLMTLAHQVAGGQELSPDEEAELTRLEQADFAFPDLRADWFPRGAEHP
ncbi:MAG: DUF1957 domain-containing protein [Deltaproteobacteria bacterium]|nr:DUF1957 domain-containing protein [Deltaproteobacteria bacterium]